MELVMDVKTEHVDPAVHISVEAYLNQIVQGHFPSRLLDNCPLDDFEHNGQKYTVDLEQSDQEVLYPEGDFEQIISSNPIYVIKLMNRYSVAVENFIDALNRVDEGDLAMLEGKRTLLLQAYLFKINSRSELPSSIQNNHQKIAFFRDFCHQVAQAFIAGRSPKDFKQFAATRPKNINRMRGMVNYLSLNCISKRQLYGQFIANEDYINAHALTLLPESDLKMQLLNSLISTFNEAVLELKKTPRKRFSHEQFTRFDLKIFSSSNSSEAFELLELSSRIIVDDVLKYIIHLLKDLKDSLKDKQTRAVLAILRKNLFFAKSMNEFTLPEELIEKIQDHLNQNISIEIGSYRVIF